MSGELDRIQRAMSGDPVRKPYSESSLSRYDYEYGGEGYTYGEHTNNPSVRGDAPLLNTEAA